MDLIIFIVILKLYFSKNKPLAIIGFLSLITSYFGYGQNATDFVFHHNISDLGLFFVIIVFAIESYKKNVLDLKIKRVVVAFFIFLLIAAIIDVSFNNTAIVDVLKTGKSWLCLLTFFIFSKLTFEELVKVFRYIIYITFIQIVLYYFQYFTGLNIYNQISHSYEFEGKSISRGGFPPTYAYFVFLILLATNRIIKFNQKQKIMFLFLIFGTAVLSLTRSTLFFLIFSIILYYIFDKISAKKTVTILFISFIVGLILSYVPAIEQRVIDGIKDVKYSFNSNYQKSDVNENFSFRIFHFQERLNYILKKPETILFGLGFIHESSLKKKIFNIGIESKVTKNISQLDTGDFSWSSLIIRIGFLGIVLLLRLFYLMIKHFFLFRSSQFGLISFIYLILNLILLSMVSANISNGYFWPLIFLLYYFVKQENIYTTKS